MDCIFCRIANKDIPSSFIYEDEDIVAFRDISPRAPQHILIIPKKHIPSLAEVSEADERLLGKICLVARKLAEENGIAESGYRLVSNCRKDAGQEVAHLHFHLIGGRDLGCFVAE